MTKVHPTQLAIIVVLVATLARVPDAFGYQATVQDITDFVTQWGGWFIEADLTGDPLNHYWVQTSYSAKTTGNVVVLTMTRNTMQKQNKNSGQICSQDIVITRNITFDPRYLSRPDPNKALTQSSAGDEMLWVVTLPTTSNLPLVRQSISVQPPTCPKLGQQWNSYTAQTDANNFTVEFANKDQATYLLKLLASYYTNVVGGLPGDGGLAPASK